MRLEATNQATEANESTAARKVKPSRELEEEWLVVFMAGLWFVLWNCGNNIPWLAVCKNNYGNYVSILRKKTTGAWFDRSWRGEAGSFASLPAEMRRFSHRGTFRPEDLAETGKA